MSFHHGYGTHGGSHSSHRLSLGSQDSSVGAGSRSSHDGSPSPQSPPELADVRGESQPLFARQFTPDGTPLTPGGTRGPRQGRYEPAESIYGYIVVYPELHRVKYGSYCNLKVGIAFALVALNITLQVSLTMIAGNQIFDDMQANHKSLLTKELSEEDRLEYLVEHIKDREVPGMVGTPDDLEHACCAGHECVGHGMKCCGTKPGNLTGFLSARGLKPAGKAKGKKEASGGDGMARALCHSSDEGIDCTPTSYAIMDHWDELDLNKDGVWSKEEAKADTNNLGCKLGLPVTEVFRAMASGARAYWKEVGGFELDPQVANGEAIPDRYFNHWRGLSSICAAVDKNRCNGLVQQGVFDGALRAAETGITSIESSAITSIESAVEYCALLLKPDGICDKALPVTYMMYRQQVFDKCGDPTFSTGKMYTNPYDEHDAMHMVTVSYPKLYKYDVAHSRKFQFFIGLILLVWYVNLLGELGLICHLADLAWNFPSAQDADPLHLLRYVKRFKHACGNIVKRVQGKEMRIFEELPPTPREKDESATTFADISETHRMTCFFVIFLRLWLMIYMLGVGTVFTLSTYSYPDLLMNAVALAFVFELPDFLYIFLVRQEDQAALEQVGTLSYPTSLPDMKGWWGTITSSYLWGVVLFPVMCFVIVQAHHRYTVVPIYEALKCACLQEGDGCLAGQRLSRAWWDAHWASLQPLAA